MRLLTLSSLLLSPVRSSLFNINFREVRKAFEQAGKTVDKVANDAVRDLKKEVQQAGKTCEKAAKDVQQVGKTFETGAKNAGGDCGLEILKLLHEGGLVKEFSCSPGGMALKTPCVDVQIGDCHDTKITQDSGERPAASPPASGPRPGVGSSRPKCPPSDGPQPTTTGGSSSSGTTPACDTPCSRPVPSCPSGGNPVSRPTPAASSGRGATPAATDSSGSSGTPSTGSSGSSGTPSTDSSGGGTTSGASSSSKPADPTTVPSDDAAAPRDSGPALTSDPSSASTSPRGFLHPIPGAALPQDDVADAASSTPALSPPAPAVDDVDKRWNVYHDKCKRAGGFFGLVTDRDFLACTDSGPEIKCANRDCLCVRGPVICRQDELPNLQLLPEVHMCFRCGDILCADCVPFFPGAVPTVDVSSSSADHLPVAGASSSADHLPAADADVVPALLPEASSSDACYEDVDRDSAEDGANARVGPQATDKLDFHDATCSATRDDSKFRGGSFLTTVFVSHRYVFHTRKRIIFPAVQRSPWF